VIATTSSYSRKTTLFFEDVYRTHGACGSELIVVPFNQGSTGDIKQLVDFIYKSGAAKGLGWDLDYVFPFAAVSDIGSFATNLGSHSEFAQRVMLINLLRLLGSIKDTKERLGYVTRPSLVVLPLSPNHGNFGGDGLYGECKIGLETAFNRRKSESWQDYLSIAGAVIGWTRGTGLMSGSNTVAQEIERLGVRTFSTREMAFSILGLTHSRIRRLACRQPIWADLSGGMGGISDFGDIVGKARQTIQRKSSTLQVIAREAAFDYAAMILRGLQDYVGFDTITQQMERKFLKRGFNFNVILVGESGMGKSTLVNSIFSSHLVDSQGRRTAQEVIRKTTEISPVTQTLEENGVRVRLTIIDTPGFGDQCNNEGCWVPVIKYIKDQHAAYLERELKPQRDRVINDTRVHACLYFLNPGSRGLRPLDVEVLKRLTEVTNVIPVIAKSDSMTVEERTVFKRRIKEELVFHRIAVYPYPSEEDGEEDRLLNS
ncbi:cell division control protein, partial [Coemansia sp. RSA 2531]